MEKVEIWTWPTGSRDNHPTLDSHNDSDMRVLLPGRPLAPSELSYNQILFQKTKKRKC
jgi:hypothetical protein